jgi:uncharacterized protein
MKYLVLFAVLVVAYLVWRNNRLEDRSDKPAQRGAPGAPQPMVSCAFCGLHLPQADAVTGNDGRFYCGNEHRLRAGA